MFKDAIDGMAQNTNNKQDRLGQGRKRYSRLGRSMKVTLRNDIELEKCTRVYFLQFALKCNPRLKNNFSIYHS
jgi:hypothetical protein